MVVMAFCGCGKRGGDSGLDWEMGGGGIRRTHYGQQKIQQAKRTKIES